MLSGKWRPSCVCINVLGADPGLIYKDMRPWISNYIHIKGYGVITHPFPDFNDFTGFILYMGPANERGSYIVRVSLIGWVHTQNDPCSSCLLCFFNNTRWIHFIFISSSNFQMCVECKAFCRIRKFEFLANFLNLWLWLCLVFTSDPIGINNMGNRARHLFFPQLGSRTTIK